MSAPGGAMTTEEPLRTLQSSPIGTETKKEKATQGFSRKGWVGGEGFERM